MARILGLFPGALVAAKGGISANAFYRQVQAEGIGGRRSEVLALFSAAKRIVTVSPHEAFRDISQVPSGTEVPGWPTKTATGIAQNVTILYRDRATGGIKQTYYRVTTENGITREQAMAQAVSAYSDNAESYGQDLIGAVHTSAYTLTPQADA
jgi:hypothetical protein